MRLKGLNKIVYVYVESVLSALCFADKEMQNIHKRHLIKSGELSVYCFI